MQITTVESTGDVGSHNTPRANGLRDGLLALKCHSGKQALLNSPSVPMLVARQAHTLVDAVNTGTSNSIAIAGDRILGSY